MLNLDLDLSLAILHHFFVFALFGVLFSELVVVRRGMDGAAVARVVPIDAWYGVLAALILIVGFSRVIFAAKGWAYYAHNGFFWAKIGTFIVIGLLSVPPTLAFLKWRRAGNLADRRGYSQRAALSLDTNGTVSTAAGLCGDDGSRLWRVLMTSSRNV
jgi:putative membrane protein